MIWGKFIKSFRFDELVSQIQSLGYQVQSGFQGEGWIWIECPNGRIEIDEFTSYNYEIKGPLQANEDIIKLVGKLHPQYKITLYDEPELEAHE